MDMLTRRLYRNHAINDLELILSVGVRGRAGDEGEPLDEMRTGRAARELWLDERTRPSDPMGKLEYERSLLSDKITPSSPVTRSNCIVRISQGGSGQNGCDRSKLQSVCPVLRPVGPCGPGLRTITGRNPRKFKSQSSTNGMDKSKFQLIDY